MNEPTLAGLAAELAAVRAEQLVLRARLARWDRWRVGRARLVAVLGAVLLLALVPLAALADTPFTDLNAGSVHNANIDAIYNAGITTGCFPLPDSNPRYCPNDAVTREQMASFLARAAGLGGNPPVANAQTAQTAANATQLGGLAASGYATRAQTRAISLLNGTATFASNAPWLSDPLTTNGGTVLILASGSAARALGQGPGVAMLEVRMVNVATNVIVGSVFLQGYALEQPVHTTLPAQTRAFNGVVVPPATYRLELRLGANTVTDGNDFFSITVVELATP